MNGALFDLDGVLVDSEWRYTEFWTEIEALYPTGIANYPQVIKGTTLQTIMQNYSDPAVQADITRRLMDLQATMPFDFYPGALHFLHSLREAGVKMALFTSSDPVKMGRLMSENPEFARMFEVVVDGSMVSRSKPDPEGYLLCASQLGLRPQECCVFEDSIQGLKAGRAAGGKVVGVATTYSRERVTPLADDVVDTLADMSVERFRRLFA